jgi:hypothetical protein
LTACHCRLGCKLDDWDLITRSSENFSLCFCVQTTSGVCSIFYPVGTRSSFPGIRSQGMKLTIHLHLVLRLSMHGAIPPLHQYGLMALCLTEQWNCLHGAIIVNIKWWSPQWCKYRFIWTLTFYLSWWGRGFPLSQTNVHVCTGTTSQCHPCWSMGTCHYVHDPYVRGVVSFKVKIIIWITIIYINIGTLGLTSNYFTGNNFLRYSTLLPVGLCSWKLFFENMKSNRIVPLASLISASTTKLRDYHSAIMDRILSTVYWLLLNWDEPFLIVICKTSYHSVLQEPPA